MSHRLTACGGACCSRKYPAKEKAARKEFQYDGDKGAPPPKPHRIAAEMSRGTVKLGKLRVTPKWMTLLHADRITRVSCQVAGEVARGEVTFRIPGLYRGKVAYKARKVKGAWKIEEFALPHYHQKTVRNTKGVWKIETTPKKKDTTKQREARSGRDG